MGGIQSLSRSTYSKYLPVDTQDTTSFFSFYDVTEKLAIVIGLFSFAYIEEITGNIRYSIIALASFFIIGLILLFVLKKIERKEAPKL
ncbi:Vacuole effluxer Atg22 like protein [compost metagenome]